MSDPVEFQHEFAKIDEHERLVFGWANVVKEGTPLPIGWWVGFKVLDDDVWKGVTDGRYKMFSIRGSGDRSPIAESDADGTVDLQGDVIDLPSFEKAAYEAVLTGLIGDEMHARDVPTVRCIESFFVTPEKLAAMGVTDAAAS